MSLFSTQIRNHIQDLISRLLGKKEHSNLYRRLARGATGTLVLKITFSGLSLIISVLLTRLLGVAGFGAYAYAQAWVGLLGVPAILGLDNLLIRNIAAYQARSAWSLIKGLWHWANQVALLVSLGLALLAASVSWVLASRFDSQMLTVFWVSLLLLPLVSLARVRQAILQGLHCVVIGKLPEMLLQPLFFITLLGGTYLFLGRELVPSWAMGMNAVASGIALLIGAKLLRLNLPRAVHEASSAYQASAWIRSALPLLFVTGMHVINSRTDTLMLGAIKGAESVGIYAVVSRGSELIPFFMMSVNAALGPTIASLYPNGNIKQLQQVVTKSARASLLAALPVGLGLFVFGDWFLLIFGPDFTQGQLALTILTVGQLVNVAMGSVGLLLIMTGYERDAAMGVAISAVLNIILNAILIPRWGLEGAAVATASSMILWNLLLARWVYKRLGIYSTVLGRISLQEEI